MNDSLSKLWFAIEITVVPEAAEAMEYALNSLDALGTEINHLRKQPGDTVTVIGYFNDLPKAETAQDEIHYALRIYGLTEDAVLLIERREVEDTDWLLEWKKHWKPTHVGGFVIAPPWENVEDVGKIVIRIEPNMAFGTGTHETTQLCISAIELNYNAGESFLDVGTGTGILAIAAAKLNAIAVAGYPSILAYDTDIDSIAIAKENAVLNGVGDAIDFRVGSLSRETPVYEIVCANLTLDVILPNLTSLFEKAGRLLVMSGILREQEDAIATELHRRNRSDFRIERSGEWIAVTVDV